MLKVGGHNGSQKDIELFKWNNLLNCYIYTSKDCYSREKAVLVGLDGTGLSL